MNDEELKKKKIEEIIGLNIWFDEDGSLHYDYGDMMEQFL